MGIKSKINKNIAVLLLGILAMMNFLTVNANGSVEIQFSGTLWAGACDLSADSSLIEIQFLPIGTKYFDLYDRSVERRFQISLEECEVGRTVQVQFKGTEATAPGLEGLLKISGKQADELGIELVEYVNDVPRILTLQNGTAESTTQTLTDKVQLLKFGAYLKTASAVRNGSASVTPGAYSAIANFELIYE
ncbi:fimbrial protein [Xenorhabdus japonica]|uniref:Pilin (Type 1 fimbria component protein) n=1 Tax=Xenorhabdus japonica TaxID=53341 RepID=A0A1I5EE96_9GAMM|nr:fimbrial protein [Xenorhabdus japonica]SFO09673.1 Pilin (type 1 fimbria component protein) [Xenorhabdus japonica]